MLLLAKFLPRDKYSVALACACENRLNSWCQSFMELGLKVVRFKVAHKHDPRHFFYLKKILPEFDLLHLHIWNPASCRFGFLAASKTPIVVTEHDPFPLSGIKSWLKKKLMTRARAVIVASQAARKMVIEQNADTAPQVRLVQNGIDTDYWEKFSHLENRNEFRSRHFGVMQNEKVILCVAELHERKGQKFLIEAVKMLEKDFPKIKLVFVGDGYERKSYEKLSRPLHEKVLFMGRQKEVGKLMAAADIFVLPSVREAFGLVILEAAMSGAPTVASDVGGISEIIENGKTGLLARAGDSESLAEAIIKILKNPDLAAQLAQNAKLNIRTAFSAKTMADKTAAVYDSVLSSPT